jgi:hypothetical protein
VSRLRRPGKAPFASAEADAWRGAPEEADFNRRQGLRPVGRLCRPGKRSLRRRRPTLGAPAPEEADFNRRRAFGRRSACAPNEFGLQGPLAGGRPAPTEKILRVGGGRRLARSALRGRFQSASKAFGRWVACADRESVLCVGGGRRPARQRLRRPISIGAKAFGRRSACADREKILLRRRRPTLGAQRLKRPISIGFQGRRLARSAFEGRFQSAPGWRSGLPLLPASVIESRCPETADGR